MSVKAFIYLLIVILSLGGCGTRTVEGPFPTIEHDRVVFQNGRIITFEGDKVALQNNITHPEKGKPVNVVERAFVVEDWKRVIVETEYGYYEDGGYVFRFYNYDGTLLKKSGEYFGSFRRVLLPKVDRLILVQISSHYSLSTGYILDPDGNQVGTITQKPRAYNTFISKEGDLFLISYRRRSGGVAFWTVDMLDADGKVLTTQDFKTGGTYSIKSGNRSIRFSLPDIL